MGTSGAIIAAVAVPFRAQAAVELCTECKAPSSGACRRCGRPLCAQHLPGRRQRCDPCEAYFGENLPELSSATRAALRAAPVLGLLPAVVLIWMAGIVGALIGGKVLGPWGLLGFFPGFVGSSAAVKALHDSTLDADALRVRACRRARRRFLRERKRPRELAGGPRSRDSRSASE